MLKLNKDLAEIIGIILGDGYIYSKNGACEVVISSHSEDDIVFLRSFVEPLVKNIFDVNPKYYFAKESKNVKLRIQSKKVVESLISVGLKPGNKLRNNISIPKWIFKNKIYLSACIRGLFDTDGSVFPKSAVRTLSQIEISCEIPALRESFRRGLLLLGFKPSNWSTGSNTPNCGLYARDQVFKYFREVGFNNPKHRKRFINISGLNP